MDIADGQIQFRIHSNQPDDQDDHRVDAAIIASEDRQR